LAFHLLPKFRKRTLSNLSLATSLNLSPEEKLKIAKGSFENLMITCLEFAKFSVEKEIERIATCENPELAAQLMKEGKPVIFFCGHQANWEVLFLEGTRRMPGVAIGRPVKNHRLYAWVLAMRQKYGGKIIEPKSAIKEGLRGLKRGAFLGIVGDQGMPDSGYSSPFFGRRAWTSPMAAILAYRTGSPIMVASTRRIDGKYRIHYSNPIWPDQQQPLNEEVDRMMRLSLSLLEESIRQAPEQWLWTHNRWKQQTPDKLKRSFRQECLLIALPQEQSLFDELLKLLPAFRELYPLEFITLFVPKQFAGTPLLNDAEIILYETLADLLIRGDQFKLVFNFSGFPEVSSHFKKLSAFTVVDLKMLKRLSTLPPDAPLKHHLKQAVCRAP
jgi:KDO2-lipid IV(A) lauroyltransferase